MSTLHLPRLELNFRHHYSTSSRGKETMKLLAGLCARMARKDYGTDKKRPKRIVKPVTRFEQEDSPPSRPQTTTKFERTESVLCHCLDCEKRNFTVQALYAHYGRTHSGSLSWFATTFSCPFCPSNARPRIFKSFKEIESHVDACHSGQGELIHHRSDRMRLQGEQLMFRDE